MFIGGFILRSSMVHAVVIDGNSLTLDSVSRVARDFESVVFPREARERVVHSRSIVSRALEKNEVVYGVTTGFGKLSDIRIPHEQIEQLQINLLRSHACGVGELLEEAEVRAALLLRANTLAKGFSGVRPQVIDTLVEMLNRGVHPVVPSRGSVGASGDLAPAAHISLLNGTQFMAAVGGLALDRALSLVESADVIGALTLEVLLGTPAASDPRIHAVRPHPGQRHTATNIRRLLQSSAIVESHKDCGQLQDAYSLRCMPQVHGAIRDALTHIVSVLQIEVNSATDNPLVFPGDETILSGGNFHGAPVAYALDYAAIAVSDLANISERRLERLVNPDLSGLPAFLIQNAGLSSGYMMLQVMAASLVSENKILSHPASVDSIPTSANKEDHVSMGMTAALKFRSIVNNAEIVLASEMLAACQAMEFRKPLKPGAGTGHAYALVRRHIPLLEQDREVSPDVQTLVRLIREKHFARLVTEAGEQEGA